MQKLQDNLLEITAVVKQLSDISVATLDDAKSLKSLVYIIDKILHVIETETTNITLIKLGALHKISAKTTEILPALEEVESKFMIKYAAKPRRDSNIRIPSECETMTIPVEIAARVVYPARLYATHRDIPEMQYGAVLKHGRPLIIFRYAGDNFVSCTACTVIDFTGLERTICCSNTPETCVYGDRCRYFHDPAIWPYSDHVQKFIRHANMIKKCPHFGNSEMLSDQIAHLNFNDLRTLARYCATMMLYIQLVAVRDKN